MPWQLVGLVGLGPASDEVVVGRVAADLIDGNLPLLVETVSPSDPRPLGFGVVGFVDDSGIRSLPAGRYYPQREPQLLPIGPGYDATVAGSIRIRPRSYNRRWLEAGYPAAAWFIRVDAMAEAGATFPRFTPAGIVLGADEYVPAGSDGDPDSSFALIRRV
jgi:hypothetical protein